MKQVGRKIEDPPQEDGGVPSGFHIKPRKESGYPKNRHTQFGKGSTKINGNRRNQVEPMSLSQNDFSR